MAFNPTANPPPINLFNSPIKPPLPPIQNQSPVPQSNAIQNIPAYAPPQQPGYSNVPNNPNGFSNPPRAPSSVPSPILRPPFPNNVYQNNVSLNSSRNSSPALNYSGQSNSPIPQMQHVSTSNSHSPSFSQGNAKNFSQQPQIPPSMMQPSKPPQIDSSYASRQSIPPNHTQPLVNNLVPTQQGSVKPPFSQLPTNRNLTMQNQIPISNIPQSSQNQIKPPFNQMPQIQPHIPISLPQQTNLTQTPIPHITQMNAFNQPPNPYATIPPPSLSSSNQENKTSYNQIPIQSTGPASLPFPSRQINSTMPPLVPNQGPPMQQLNQNPNDYSTPPMSTNVYQYPKDSSHAVPYSQQNQNVNIGQPNLPPPPNLHPPQSFPPMNCPNTIAATASHPQANILSQYPHVGPPSEMQYPHINPPPDKTQEMPPYMSMNNFNGQQQDLSQQIGRMNIHQTGFNKLWGHETVDLLQCRNILPEGKIEPPVIKLNHQFSNSVNCSPEIFRCTLTKIPETNSLLQKSRLPLGVLIHPFKDLTHLPVIQCSSIVRCRSCRTYINPFVYFIDLKRWKCNLCYRVNDLPEEFQYDPVTKSYGDPTRRPEIQSATIEYIAPSEYMLRPPQPAAYLFLLDVSASAAESGYLKICCDTLIEQIDNLPGDTRTQLAFICYDSAIHFYFLGEGASRPKEMTVIDIDDVFLPSPEDLLVNLAERRTAIVELLAALPERHGSPSPAATQSALGAALQAAQKLMTPTGGRITVFQTCLTNVGPGALTAREDPNNRSSKDVAHLNPATDFYKRQALNCSGVQIAVDLFLLNSQYADLSTISGVSRFSGGSIYHLPLFKASREWQAQEFKRTLTRYFTRKIGFEAVMRIRCTRGLTIHAFHGSFFVRSTDLLSLPNVSPDAGFGIQLAIEENLSDVQHVCFQAALLYTSSKGERRIRVHTLCLPVVATLTDIIHSADQQCIAGLLAKMAVDRSQTSSLSDAREALINAAVDALGTVKVISGPSHGLMCPMAIRLLPLYLLALLKHTAFRTGTSTRLDDRVAAMCQMKSLPLASLLRSIYPDLYPVYKLSDYIQRMPQEGEVDGEEVSIPNPPRLRLSAEKINATGAYLLDQEDTMILYIGHSIHPNWLRNVFGVDQHNQIRDDVHTIPTIETEENTLLHAFIDHLNDEKPFAATLLIIRDNSPNRTWFTEKLADDRVESALSYYEFLQHVKSQMK